MTSKKLVSSYKVFLPSSTDASILPDYVQELDGKYLNHFSDGTLEEVSPRDCWPTLVSIIAATDEDILLKISDAKTVQVRYADLVKKEKESYSPAAGVQESINAA